MADIYLAELKRDGTATAVSGRVYDTGAESIEIMFELDEPLPDGAKTIVGQLWLTDKSKARTKDTLKSVGVDWDSSAYADEIDDKLYRAIETKRFRLACALEAANDFHRADKWICRYINGPKAESVGSLLSRLRGSQPSLPLGGSDDSDAPF